MLKNRKLLEDYLDKKILDIATNREIIKTFTEMVSKKYDVSEGSISDFLTCRKPLVLASDYMLFCITSIYDEIYKRKNVSEYFTEVEIKQYSKKGAFKVGSIFPIKINCQKVNEDQWIGVVSSDFLIKLSEYQLMYYNVNTQRTMKVKHTKGGDEVYQISVNKRSVNAIKSLLKGGFYIFDDLTFNMPFDDDMLDYYYDEESSTLVINAISHFDILDGFHRLRAIIDCCHEDENFKCNMELRIVNFTENKARQFIFQKDQKNKMTRVDSKSMNMSNSANIVAAKLNENPMFNLKGEISRNEGKINFSRFADAVGHMYFKNKDADRKEQLKCISDLKDKINLLTETYQEYLEHKYTDDEIFVLVYLCKKCSPEDVVKFWGDIYVNKIIKIDELSFKHKQNAVRERDLDKMLSIGI